MPAAPVPDVPPAAGEPPVAPLEPPVALADPPAPEPLQVMNDEPGGPPQTQTIPDASVHCAPRLEQVSPLPQLAPPLPPLAAAPATPPGPPTDARPATPPLPPLDGPPPPPRALVAPPLPPPPPAAIG